MAVSMFRVVSALAYFAPSVSDHCRVIDEVTQRKHWDGLHAMKRSQRKAPLSTVLMPQVWLNTSSSLCLSVSLSLSLYVYLSCLSLCRSVVVRYMFRLLIHFLSLSLFRRRKCGLSWPIMSTLRLWLWTKVWISLCFLASLHPSTCLYLNLYLSFHPCITRPAI